MDYPVLKGPSLARSCVARTGRNTGHRAVQGAQPYDRNTHFLVPAMNSQLLIVVIILMVRGIKSSAIVIETNLLQQNEVTTHVT